MLLRVLVVAVLVLVPTASARVHVAIERPIIEGGEKAENEINAIVTCIRLDDSLDTSDGIIPPDIPDACNPDPCVVLPYRTPGLPGCDEIVALINP